MVPIYDGVTYNFLTLQWCESSVNPVETILGSSNFDLSLARDVRYVCSHDTGQRPPAIAWDQPGNRKNKQLVLYSAFIVLGDFAQLYTTISVLSMLKTG